MKLLIGQRETRSIRWSTPAARRTRAGVADLGFNVAFVLPAGVSTSTTRIEEEGQPGGVCPMVIKEPNLRPPSQRWGYWEGRETGQKTSLLCLTPQKPLEVGGFE